MPLPSDTDLCSLDYSYRGAPFVQVEAKSLDSESLDVSYHAEPFVAVGPVPIVGLNVYVRASGVWKQATAVYVRAGGAWKTVSTISTRVGGVWKS